MPNRPHFTTQHVFSTLLPPSPSAPCLPEFDFYPSDSLLASSEEGVEFVVANPLDLMFQEQGLMADVLVVEVRGGPGTLSSMLWFRFDTVSLATRGKSACRLFSDDGVDATAGWLTDRKRM
jgi:hypothetical protein